MTEVETLLMLETLKPQLEEHGIELDTSDSDDFDRLLKELPKLLENGLLPKHILAWYKYHGIMYLTFDELDTAVDMYCGEWDSLAEFYQDYVSSELPDHLKWLNQHIDWDGIAKWDYDYIELWYKDETDKCYIFSR